MPSSCARLASRWYASRSSLGWPWSPERASSPGIGSTKRSRCWLLRVFRSFSARQPHPHLPGYPGHIRAFSRWTPKVDVAVLVRDYPNSASYRQHTVRIVTAMASRYGSHPAVGSGSTTRSGPIIPLAESRRRSIFGSASPTWPWRPDCLICIERAQSLDSQYLLV
jgi:hypothetical protein